jgi:hypothetical protein
MKARTVGAVKGGGPRKEVRKSKVAGFVAAKKEKSLAGLDI